MGIPIKKMNVTDEEAKNIIRAGLGNKLIGNIPQNFDSKFDFIWKFTGDKK